MTQRSPKRCGRDAGLSVVSSSSSSCVVMAPLVVTSSLIVLSPRASSGLARSPPGVLVTQLPRYCGRSAITVEKQCRYI